MRFQIEVGATKLRRFNAYWESLKDSRRIDITLEELCGFQWSLRSKLGTGKWRSEMVALSDPWWQEDPTDGSPRRPTWITRFHPDGTISGSGVFLGGPLSQGYGWTALCGGSIRVCDTVSMFERSQNWGWILQNICGIATSWPHPPHGSLEAAVLYNHLAFSLTAPVENWLWLDRNVWRTG